MSYIKKFFTSVSHASRGLRYIFVHEQNFRLQVIATLVLIVVVWFLPLKPSEMIVLLCLALFVLVLEIINSAMEKFIDMLKPRLSYQAGIIKDMLAGMVLIAGALSLLIAGMILIPTVFELIAK